MNAKKMIPLGAILCLLLLSLLPARGLAQEGGPTPQAPEIQPVDNLAIVKNYIPIIQRNKPPTFFGFESWYLNQAGGLDLMVNAGASWGRRNALVWYLVEPNQGARNWGAVSSIESELTYASSKNLQTILIVRGTPGWAQSNPPFSCGPMTQPAMDAFALFMQDTVKRYSVPPYNVKYYEIWNEQDVEPNSSFNPDEAFGCWGNQNQPDYGGRYYGEMLKKIYPAMKAANGEVQVLVGGLLLDCDPNNPPSGKNCTPSNFIKGILNAGAGNSFDGVAFHAYDYYGYSLGSYSNSNWASAWNSTGPVLIAKARYLRNILDSNGFTSKYLINSEVALICGTTGQEASCQTQDFKNTKAYFLTEAFAHAKLEQLRAQSWYSVFGWRGSQLMSTSQVVEPVYNAYSFAASKFGNAQNAYETFLSSGMMAVDFEVGSRMVRVMWSKNGGTHTVSIPANTSGIWVWDNSSGKYVGAPVTSTFNVGRAPVYVEYRK